MLTRFLTLRGTFVNCCSARALGCAPSASVVEHMSCSCCFRGFCAAVATQVVMTESEAGLSFPLLWNLVSMGLLLLSVLQLSDTRSVLLVVQENLHILTLPLNHCTRVLWVKLCRLKLQCAGSKLKGKQNSGSRIFKTVYPSQLKTY